jgi:hypothetical protein
LPACRFVQIRKQEDRWPTAAALARLPVLPSFGAYTAIPAAAILVSAGLFLSSAGRERTGPNRLILLLYAGMASLAFGAVALGVGLLTA